MPITIIPNLDESNKVRIDRSRWKFDEDGFAKANNAALLQAQQEMREKIHAIHSELASTYHPNDYDVKVGGVPIDKAEIEKI